IPPRTVYVQVEVPGGTNAAFTNGIAEEIERRLPGIPGIEDAASVVATVRQSTGGADMMGTGASPANVAVNFKVYQEREHDVFETLEYLQEEIGEGIAGADISVAMPANGPPSGPPVNLEITGDDPAV